MTKQICLTRDKTTIVDDEDYLRLMLINTKWFAHKLHRTFYAETKQDGKVIKMHRVIAGNFCETEIDHINHDGLDNRRCNLRIVSRAENLQNKQKYNNNTSGTAGVYYSVTRRGRKFWHAQIAKGGKQRLIGRFLTKDEAIKARLEAEK